MYTLHKELHEPSAVRHVVESHFFSPKRTQLLVVKANVLSVFNLVADEDHDTQCHLEEATSFAFQGIPSSVASVSVACDEPDLLFLTFDDSKVSVVQFDAETNDIRTVSLHDFSCEKGSTWDVAAPMKVVVDPQGRCAALVVFGVKLIIISLKKSRRMDLSAQRFETFASRVIDLSSLPHPIGRVDDFVFLENYDTPCLAILHQPRPVWTGRYAVLKDASAITCLSVPLDTDSTVVWRHSTLPGDSYALVANATPAGGVFVITINSIAYINQSTSLFLAVNGFARRCTDIEMTIQEGMSICFDHAAFVLIDSSKLLISLESGDIYLLHVMSNGSVVESIYLEMIAKSSIPSALSMFGSKHLFIASRHGNSYLVELEHIPVELEDEVSSSAHEPSVLGDVDDDFDDFYATGSGVDVSEPHGTVQTSRKKVHTTLKIHARDVMPTLAPYKSIAMGLPTDEHRDMYSQQQPLEEGNALTFRGSDDAKYVHVDYTACIGNGKNGAFAQLHHSLRPDILLSDSMFASCHDCWALCMHKSYHHKYIFLSSGDHTEVLVSTNEGLKKVADNRGFEAKKRSIHVANVLSRNVIVQVTHRHLNLISERDGMLVTVYDNSFQGKKARRVSVADPYIAILFNDRTCKIYKAAHSEKSGFYVRPLVFKSGSSKISCMSLYTDKTGFFSLFDADELKSKREKRERKKSSINASTIAATATTTATTVDAGDNIDELFGDGDDLFQPSVPMTSQKKSSHGSHHGNEGEVEDEKDGAILVPKAVKKKTHFLTVFYKNGSMTIFKVTSSGKSSGKVPTDVVPIFTCTVMSSLPTLAWDRGVRTGVDDGKRVVTPQEESVEAKRSKISYELPLGSSAREDILDLEIDPKELVDGSNDRQQTVDDEEYEGDQDEEWEHKDDADDVKYRHAQQNIAEVMLFGFGKGTRPHLLIRNKAHNFVMYEIFRFSDTDEMKYEGRLQARLRKVVQRPLPPPLNVGFTIQSLRAFSRMGGCDGVFVCGSRPLVLLCGRGNKVMRSTEMIVDGGITSFTYYNHRQASHTFVYMNSQGLLRVACAPQDFCLTSSVISKRNEIKKSVVFIDFDPSSGVYVVCIKEKFENRTMPPQGSIREDLNEGSTLSFGAGEFPPMEDKFSIQLISPEDWSIVPNTKIEVEDFFHVTSFKVVRIVSTSSASGLKHVAAVGLAPLRGEMIFEKGKIELYEVIEVNPEPGFPTTKNRLKLHLSSNVRGMVSCVDSVSGFLVGCTGTDSGCRTFVWRVEDTLQPIAFYESEVLGVTMKTVGAFIILGDYSHGVTLLRFMEDRALKNLQRDQKGAISKILVPVGRDAIPANVYAVEFVSEGDKLRFLFFDDRGNVIVLQYDSRDPDTRGGRLLVRESSYNIGQRTVAVTRLKAGPSGLDTEESERHLAMYYTLDGGIGCIVPLPDDVYERFTFLLPNLAKFTTHHAGLTSKSFRQYRGSELVPGHKHVQRTLDAESIKQFLLLDVNIQQDLAREAGTTAMQIHKDILSIDAATTFV
eukprot:m.97103 g.97103  ORF g.97103 m.97103 type:complete len:1514 (+) comp8980_c0_seq3:91-4632(+)